MRDDIHKQVPRPRWVQQWVKRAVNDADRLNGRSLDALNDSIRQTCSHEISAEFRNKFLQELAEPAGLFGPLGNIRSPRDLGSPGGHLEAEVLSEAKRLLARGHSTDTVGVMALASVLETRVQADIRAASPVLLGTRDRKAWLVVNQMQADAGMVDCTDHARAALTPATRNAGRPTQPRITPDEDLRSRAAAGKR